MKYIKKYEDKGYNYKLGDYVLLGAEFFKIKKTIKSKIIEIVDYDPDDIVPYYVMDDEGDSVWVRDDMIERYLTPEEIEEYDLKISSKKYNL